MESQSLTFTQFESEQMLRKAFCFSFRLDLRPWLFGVLHRKMAQIKKFGRCNDSIQNATFHCDFLNKESPPGDNVIYVYEPRLGLGVCPFGPLDRGIDLNFAFVICLNGLCSDLIWLGSGKGLFRFDVPQNVDRISVECDLRFQSGDVTASV